MPGTANRRPNEESLRERPSVMRAIRGEREELLTAPRENDGISESMAEQHCTITQLGFVDSLREIRTGQLAAFHFVSSVEAE